MQLLLEKWCLEGVWRVSGGCLGVSGGCLEGVWRMSGGYLWSF